MFWSPFPFVRYAICLSAGIVLCDSGLLAGIDLLPLLQGFLLALVAAFIASRIRPFAVLKMLSGLLGLAALVITGYVVALESQDDGQPHHYTSEPGVQAFSGVIASERVERKNYHRYELALDQLQINDTASRAVYGKIYLYIRKAKDAARYQYGDRLHVSGALL